MTLAEAFPEPIVIELDKPRKLEYTFAAWRKLEARYGGFKQVMAALGAMVTGEGLLLENLLNFLWAGLSVEDPTITIETLERMLRVDRVPEYIQAVSRAVEQAFPPRDAVRPPTAPAGNGTGGGPTGLPEGPAASANPSSGA